jgi:hypothetical protein
MPDTYTVLDSYRSVQIFTGTTVRDAMIVTCETIPTGIRFAQAIDLSIWELNQGSQLLPMEAGILEECVQGSHAVGGTESQDFDNNGLLAFYCDLIIALDRTDQGLPTLYGEAHIPMRVIEVEASTPSESVPAATAAQYCETEYNRLVALNTDTAV